MGKSITVQLPDLTEMYFYVSARASFRVTDEEFDLVESGFRDYWNISTGKLITVEEFKQVAWDSLHPAVKYYYPRVKSDEIVELILMYMNSIGHYET